MTNLCLKGKISLPALFFLLIAQLTSNAQLNPPVGAGPWKYVVPFQHGYNMNDMSFIDNNTGLAVGNNGAIARTTDGGRNWQYLSYKFINPANTVALAQLNDVQFVTPSIAYAVGGSGLMIKSTDGGLNWSPIVTPLTRFNKNINGLHFLNKDTGYIGGAAILSTNSTTTININEAPKVYFTRNGGATWDSLITPFRPRQYNTALPTPNPVLSGFNTAEIYRIVFLNDSVGYISGSCGQSLTQYSAILWKFEKGILKDYSLHRTKFGISLFSGAGAAHTPSTSTYRGLLPINDSLVLISANTNGIVVRVKTGKNDSTANAVPAIYGAYERGVYEVVAQVNTNPTFPPNSPLNTGTMWHIKKAPGNKIVMSNGRSVAFSTDNGTSWTATNPIPASSNIAHWQYNAMDVTPNGRIVVGGVNGITYDSLPGAAGWSTVYNNIRPLFYSYSDMDWADPCNGILVGANGTIAKTTDGGKNWVDISNPIFDASGISIGNVFYPAVNSMYFSTSSFGFIGIHKSADQGASYQTIFAESNPNSGGINNFTMIGQSRAWAVAHRFSPAVQRTMIFRTLNADAASPVWDTVKTFPLGTLAPQLRNIKFANQDTGYVSGSRSKVYRTINGGATWTDVSFDTLAPNNNINYTGLSVINGKTVYVGGSSGKLWKTTDAGVTWTNISLVPTTNPTTISAFTSISTIVMNDVNNGYINAGAYLLKTSDGWATWTYDMPPQSFSNISLYPKISGPIENKKLYGMPLIFGFPGPISTQSAALIEYGNPALINVSSTEPVTNATCTNPNGGSITVNAVGGIAPYTFSINGGTFQSSNIFTGLSQGPKTIVIKDNGCQTITKTINVGFTDNLALTKRSDTIVCAGAPVQMSASTNGTGSAYTWSPSGGLSAANISNPVAIVNNNAAYTVTATLNGCVRTGTVNIGIKPNPVINAGPDKTIVDGDQVTLNGSGITNPVSVAWTPAASILSGVNTYTAVAKPNITTTYTMTVRNSDNCTSTDDAIITVLPYCIKAMNAFTPNGDGMNDRWLVTNGGCTKEIKVAVYNRYGNVIYTNNTYSNNWDGTYKGRPVADGTYYYTVTYQTITGNFITIKGDVTILR